MAKTYNRLEIDVNKKPTDIITAVQADNNSRYLDVSLFNNGVPLDLPCLACFAFLFFVLLVFLGSADF